MVQKQRPPYFHVIEKNELDISGVRIIFGQNPSPRLNGFSKTTVSSNGFGLKYTGPANPFTFYYDCKCFHVGTADTDVNAINVRFWKNGVIAGDDILLLPPKTVTRTAKAFITLGPGDIIYMDLNTHFQRPAAKVLARSTWSCKFLREFDDDKVFSDDDAADQ